MSEFIVVAGVILTRGDDRNAYLGQDFGTVDRVLGSALSN